MALILCFTPFFCYAGDIPEGLLYNDNASVYFGEVKKMDGTEITVIQRKRIKGDFVKGREITYPDFSITPSPEIGKHYLCGSYGKKNPLYLWEVTGFDTHTLEIQSIGDMSKRMQEYLNSGEFEKKEQERVLRVYIEYYGELLFKTTLFILWLG